MTEEHGWIRNATIVEAKKIESRIVGGYIRCRTDKTGPYWVYLPRTYYMSVVSSLSQAISHARIAESVKEFLRGQGCDVRVKHTTQDSAGDGRLQHMWDATIHLHMSAAVSDYRLGEKNHG